MKQVSITEAKANFSRLLRQAAAGEEVVIAKWGKPVARLVRLEKPTEPREPGALRGRITIAEDFDAPLPRAWWMG